jgi:hypothetical protein
MSKSNGAKKMSKIFDENCQIEMSRKKCQKVRKRDEINAKRVTETYLNATVHACS